MFFTFRFANKFLNTNLPTSILQSFISNKLALKPNIGLRKKSKQKWLPCSDNYIRCETAGHYWAIGDQVNKVPKLELPLKRRHVWLQTAGISWGFVNKKL